MDFNDIKNFASSEKLGDLKDKAASLKDKAGEVAHTVADKAAEIGKSVNIDSVKSVADKVGEGAKKFASAIDHLPGAAVDAADKNKVDNCEVKQDTRMLNNNPRNTDIEMP
ncbi:MAG: hypothetical protein K2L97_00225 [Muribaculaceae bacterium]|nr:hypothetical protein [Muribaculaceae bacterium]